MGSKPPGHGRCRECGGELAAISSTSGVIELLCVRCDALTTVGADPANPESGGVGGCAACGSSDRRYVLVADEQGTFTRMSFCSVDCLGKKLGLVRES